MYAPMMSIEPISSDDLLDELLAIAAKLRALASDETVQTKWKEVDRLLDVLLALDRAMREGYHPEPWRL